MIMDEFLRLKRAKHEKFKIFENCFPIVIKFLKQISERNAIVFTPDTRQLINKYTLPIEEKDSEYEPPQNDAESDTIRALSPWCNERIPHLSLDNGIITINCGCPKDSHNNKISVHEFIQKYNENKNTITYQGICNIHKRPDDAAH